MAYLHPFLRLVVSGSLYTSERFSWSCSFINDFGTGTAPTEVPAGVVSAISTYMGDNHISQVAKTDLIKLNLIGTDGRYVSAETVQHEFATPIPGLSTERPAPQVALAVTLNTAFRRGRAARGRFYLPTPAAKPDTNGLVPLNDVTTVRDRTVVMLEAIEAALPGWDLGVVSDIGAGAQHAVTSIRVGRVLDTIRSRRTSLPETYTEDADYETA